MRILGIIGTSFCGSTYLARLLDQLEGYVSPGEIHWLVDEPGTERSRCRHGMCGGLDPLRATPPAPEALYDAVGCHLNGGEFPEVLVSSDKHPCHFTRFVGPWGMSGAMLYKTPEGHALSEAKHHGSAWDVAADEWADFYEMVLDWAPAFCSRVECLSYDDLAAAPVASVRELLRRLLLHPWATVAPNDLGDGHHIGGNPGGREALVGYHDRAWATELLPGAREGIKAHAKAQKVLAELEGRRLRWV
jgi:hypothetical protein